MDIAQIRRDKGFSQNTLERLTNISAENLSAIETGRKRVGVKVARKMADALDVDPDEIIVFNRAAAIKRAVKDRDPEEVLSNVRAIVKIADSKDLLPEGERYLDGLIDSAIKFAHAYADGTLSFEDDDEDDEDNEDDSWDDDDDTDGYTDHRDHLGRYVGPRDAAHGYKGNAGVLASQNRYRDHDSVLDIGDDGDWDDDFSDPDGSDYGDFRDEYGRYIGPR